MGKSSNPTRERVRAARGVGALERARRAAGVHVPDLPREQRGRLRERVPNRRSNLLEFGEIL